MQTRGTLQRTGTASCTLGLMMALLAYVQPDIADSSTLVLGNFYDTDGVHHPSELGGRGFAAPHQFSLGPVRFGCKLPRLC